MIWGLFYILASIISIACAVQLIVKIGVKKASISFSAGMSGLAILFLSSAIILIVPYDSAGFKLLLFKIADVIVPLAASITPFLFFIISRNYGRTGNTSDRRFSILTRLVGLTAIIIVFFIVSQMVYESLIHEGNYVLVFQGFLAKVVGIIIGVMLILSLANFENTLRASSGLMRKQLFILILFSLLLFSGFIRMFFLGKLTSLFFIYMSPVALVCSGWLYILLLPKNIYSENLIVDRQAFLSSAIILFLGIFLVFTGIVAYIIKQAGGRIDIFLSILGACLVIGLFLLILLSDSIRHRFSRAMQERVYAGRFDYKAEWRELSEDFAVCDNINDLIGLIVEKIERLITPESIAVFMAEDNTLTIKYPDTLKLTPIDLGDPFANWIFLKSEPDFIKDIQESSSNALIELKGNYEVAVPIIAERKLIGLILLDAKEKKQAYNTEELAMLSVIAQQTAVTILHLRSREKLMETEKLSSFHKTASFVVHDLKNAVSMLSLMLQNAPRKMADPEFQKESINTITQAVSRMQAIIEKLKSVPAKEQMQVYDLDPIKVLNKAIDKSGIRSKADIDITIDDDENLPVKADPAILESILINLLINAVEAMPEGGSVRIERDHLNSKQCLSVTDTGVGMTGEFIATRLFRPFETTKAKGLGIGLYQCREMFKEIGGKILVESEPGRGSKFTLVFP
jgi:putative PEP-CTERM system histidine kinase